jgi:hypothetical protein
MGMFLANCSECGRRELRGARSIEILVNTDHGIDLVYRCASCGASNVIGASRPEPASSPLVAA